MGIELVVQRAWDDPSMPTDREIARWAEAGLCDPGQEVELTIRLVDEEEGRQLNRKFRKGGSATNVLSFPSSLPEEIRIRLEAESGLSPLGDLVLCAPVIEREAAEQGKRARDHWAHLVIHGMLHLQGYDHQGPEDTAEMEQVELEILAKLGIQDPYITR
jgi:probable rRNA maturation factor